MKLEKEKGWKGNEGVLNQSRFLRSHEDFRNNKFCAENLFNRNEPHFLSSLTSINV